MNVEELKLPLPKGIVSSYYDNDSGIAPFFDYDFSSDEDYRLRLDELSSHPFGRDQLTAYLTKFNGKFTTSEAVKNSIRKLKCTNGVAVVGGQQAGLLTGPVLTIHKCISIIQQAKKLEEDLGVPVAPIFWIAGEDHDLDEINHVYVPKNGNPKKVSLKQSNGVKASASLWDWDKKGALNWVNEVFAHYRETSYTKELLELIQSKIDHSETPVDFFAALLSHWFSEDGLILLDSGDPEFKKLQTSYLSKIITFNEKVDEAFSNQAKLLQDNGFEITVDIQKGNSHLFTYEGTDRQLLFRNDESFDTKSGSIHYSKEELLNLAERHPEKLSNNVVTRPLMQEWLLPVISFIAGPGEISYWAALKEVFHLFGRKMPPVVPRLSFTMISEQTDKLLEKKNLRPKDVIINGTNESKEYFLQSNQPAKMEALVEEVKRGIGEIHEKFSAFAVELDPSLRELAQVNRDRIYREVEYMERKMEHRLRKQLAEPLQELHELELDLHPKGGLQERVWNIFQYMNLYGPNVIRHLLHAETTFNGTHKILYLNR